MDKKIIGLEHNSISPDITGIENQYSNNLHLVKGINKNLTVYVDESIRNVHFSNSKYNVGFLVEPITVAFNLYEWVKDNYDKFDMIITHHKPFLKISSKNFYNRLRVCNMLKNLSSFL